MLLLLITVIKIIMFIENKALVNYLIFINRCLIHSIWSPSYRLENSLQHISHASYHLAILILYHHHFFLNKIESKIRFGCELILPSWQGSCRIVHRTLSLYFVSLISTSQTCRGPSHNRMSNNANLCSILLHPHQIHFRSNQFPPIV